MVKIAPSMLAADWGALRAEALKAAAGTADYLHLDMMDGHFVPNLTYGPGVAGSLRDVGVPLDIHLMVERPEDLLDGCAAAAPAFITVHVEACRHLHRVLQRIADLGCVPGVALNPATPVGAVSEVLALVGLVVVMGVNPGFGGQRFIPATVERVAAMRTASKGLARPPLIEVDGGVTGANANALAQAGADILVAGTAVFGAGDVAAAIAGLRRVAGAGSS